MRSLMSVPREHLISTETLCQRSGIPCASDRLSGPKHATTPTTHVAGRQEGGEVQRSQHRLVLGWAHACVGQLLIAVSVDGQSPAPDEIFVDAIDVRLVHLDVLVRGSDGAPLYGLGPEDFSLEVDGRRVELDFFSAPPRPSLDPIESNPGPDAGASGPMDTVSSDAVSNGTTVLQPVSVGSRPVPMAGLGDWVIYFDDVALPGGSRERVRSNLKELFADWLDGPSIHVVFRRGGASSRLGPFERPEQALAALDAEDRALARAMTGGWDSLLQDFAEIERGCRVARETRCSYACVSRKVEAVRRFVAIETEGVERTLGDLADILSTFDPRARRTTLVYIGDGLEVIPGRLAYHLIADSCLDYSNEMRNRSLESRRDRLFAQVGALANAQRVTLHMLDAGGIRQPGTAIGSSYAAPRSVESERLVSLQSGFVDLAKATGGKAILNAPKPAKPLREAAEEQLVRYEMGFALNTPPSGGVLSLRLRLLDDGPGRRELSYRRTFFDQLPKDRLIQRLRGQLDPAAELPAASVVSIEPGVAEKVDRRSRKVPLTIAWPMDRVTLIPGPAGESGQVMLALTSAGPRGKVGPARELPLRIGAGGLQPVGDRYALTIGLTLVKGENRVAVAIWDQASGEQWLQVLDLDLK